MCNCVQDEDRGRSSDSEWVCTVHATFNSVRYSVSTSVIMREKRKDRKKEA